MPLHRHNQLRKTLVSRFQLMGLQPHRYQSSQIPKPCIFFTFSGFLWLAWVLLFAFSLDSFCCTGGQVPACIGGSGGVLPCLEYWISIAFLCLLSYSGVLIWCELYSSTSAYLVYLPLEEALDMNLLTHVIWLYS